MLKLCFAEDYMYIALYASICRLIDNNNISQLPEKVFSGLTSLHGLCVYFPKIKVLKYHLALCLVASERFS